MALNLKALAKAMARHTLVQFVRESLERPGCHLIGVPVAVGSRWVVFAHMDDSIRLDGFDALRIADLSSVRTVFRNREFYVRGLAFKRRVAAIGSPYAVDSTRALLASIQKRHALFTIDREAGEARGADVGRVVTFGSSHCSFRTISPSAVWRKGSERVEYVDVTRIGFGAEYEETLGLAAGLEHPLWR